MLSLHIRQQTVGRVDIPYLGQPFSILAVQLFQGGLTEQRTKEMNAVDRPIYVSNMEQMLTKSRLFRRLIIGL